MAGLSSRLSRADRRVQNLTRRSTGLQSTSPSAERSNGREKASRQTSTSRSGSVLQTLDTFFEPHNIDDEQGFTLRQNQFILGQTEESVGLTLPKDLDDAVREKGCLAGRVEGKSSLARFGLIVHFTAPTIHAGFGPAPIALELMNFGPAPITLFPGMRICQLLLEQVVGIPDMRPGQFDQQESARG